MYNNNSLFKVAKEQLTKALVKVTKLETQKEKIKTKLQEKVTIKIWFGLLKKEVTKDQHIIMQDGWNYALEGVLLGYLTCEEKDLCDYLWNIPSSSKIKSWLKAEEVYLSSDDFEELCTLLFKEPGE